MSEQIIDGSGAGYRAKVNSENQLSTYAAAVPLQHHIAHAHRKCFSAVVQQTPTGANNAFWYVKNNDADELNLWDVYMRCAAAETIEIWSVTGTAAGTAHTPVNLVVSSGVQANATSVVGNNITGLTKVALLKRYCLEAGKAQESDIHSAIIIQEAHAIAVYAVTGTALTDFSAVFDFHSNL